MINGSSFFPPKINLSNGLADHICSSPLKRFIKRLGLPALQVRQVPLAPLRRALPLQHPVLAPQVRNRTSNSHSPQRDSRWFDKLLIDFNCPPAGSGAGAPAGAAAASGAGASAAAAGGKGSNGLQGILGGAFNIASMPLNTISASLGSLGIPTIATAPLSAVSSLFQQAGTAYGR